jgi:hypothetical protein
MRLVISAPQPVRWNEPGEPRRFGRPERRIPEPAHRLPLKKLTGALSERANHG